MRYLGLGWPNGPADEPFYLDQLWPLLLLESEYKWHADKALAGGRTVLFRAMPGTPADYRWNAGSYAERVMATLPGNATHLVYINETNLNYEWGVLSEDDWDWGTMERRYRETGTFATAVANRIRGIYGWGGRLHWPALAPDHYQRELSHLWVPAAAQFDVVDFHAYQSADRVQQEYDWYRAAFPDKPLWLTEWNSSGAGVDEDRRILETLKRIAETDPNFHAFYFIGKWFYYPGMEGWTNQHDVEGNPERIALFLHAAVQEPEPLPEPQPEPTTEPIPMPTNLVHAIDVSNYQSATLNGLLDGVEHVIVRLSTETPAKARHAMTQLQVAYTHGLPTSGYVWAYWADDPRKAVRASLDVAHEAGIPLTSVWLDAEDAEDATPDRIVWWLREALDELVQQGHKGGIYTGRWFWTEHAGDTMELAGTPGWLAQYDNVADLASVRPCGGFTIVGKQYTGDPLDRNAFDGAWLESAAPAPAEPLDEPRAVIIGAGRSRIGDPYVWDGEEPGAFDCSGFVKWCYAQAGLALTSYTDAIYDETVPTQNPQPGDIILYQYVDEKQGGVRFPHMGIWLGPGSTLESRYPDGVDEYSPLPFGTAHIRRHPGLADQTPGEDPRMIEALRAQINEQNGIIEEYESQVAAKNEQVSGLVQATAHLADVIVPRLTTKRVSAKTKATAAAEANAIREQFVGAKPH